MPPAATFPRGRAAALGALLGWLVLCGLAMPLHADGDPVANEYALKAAFLHKFTGFIDWPPAAFPSPAAPFVIAIVGDDPFGPAIDSVLAGQRVGGRPVLVRRETDGAVPPECHLVFVGERDAARREALLEKLAERPVLTIGEAEGFLEAGGTIRLVLAGGRVRFEVNHRVAEKSGLKISSKLLALALRVIVGKKPR